MKSMKFKDAISQDIQTIKTLDIEPIPTSTFYGALAKAWGSVVGSTFALALLACLLPLNWEIWTSAKFGISNKELAFEIIVGCLIGALVMSVFTMSSVRLYVILRHQFSEHLYVGDWLIEKFHQVGCICAGIFFGAAFFIMPMCNPSNCLFAVIGSFTVMMCVFSFIINSEVDRRGVAPILQLIAEHFHKG